MEKFSFFVVKFDHETGTFDYGGELISETMGGCMLTVDDENDKIEWRYPENDKEAELDSKAERTLYLAIEKLKVDTTP